MKQAVLPPGREDRAAMSRLLKSYDTVGGLALTSLILFISFASNACTKRHARGSAPPSPPSV
jgi:hypothetical protein